MVGSMYSLESFDNLKIDFFIFKYNHFFILLINSSTPSLPPSHFPPSPQAPIHYSVRIKPPMGAGGVNQVCHITFEGSKPFPLCLD